MSRTWSAGGVLCVAWSLWGCGQPPGGDASPVTTTSSDQSPATTSANDASEARSTNEPAAAAPGWRTSVQLSPASWAETEQRIAEQRGKVVVVDVWSTACEPCLREFPHLVELQEQHPTDVVCVALNSDYAGVRNKPPEFYRDRVMKVLEAKQAKVLNVLCTEPADELFTELKIDSIPAVFVYNQAGDLVAKFDHRTTNMGEFSYAEHVNPAVAKLLAGEPISAELTPAPAP